MAKSITFVFWPLFVKWNHGIALLSSLCKSAGIDVDMCVLGSTDQFDPKGEVVGFSCVTRHDYEKCVPFIKKAKRLGRVVVLGGVWAGLDRPVISEVDYVCRGDGEKLVDFLTNNDTSVFDEFQVTSDLNELPLPDYSLFKDIPFKRTELSRFNDKKILPYVSSRGCPHKCSFCQAPLQPEYRVRFRVQEDLERIISEYEPDMIYFGDAQPPYHMRKWRESWGDVRIPFISYIRADISQDDLLWLIDRGLSGCAFGVESGDEKFRNEILQKNLTDDQLYATIRTLVKYRVPYTPFFMSNVPGESWMSQTLTTKTVIGARMSGIKPIIYEYESL